MAQQYQKKPVYVFAVQYTGTTESANDIAQNQFDNFQGGLNYLESGDIFFFIRTAEGSQVVVVEKNYVIQGSDGKFFTLSDQAFELQYRPIK
jgi:hypothetical protein